MQIGFKQNLIFYTSNIQSTNGSLKSRLEMEKQYQWQLSDLFSTDAAWEDEFKLIKSRLPEIQAFQGKLGESGQALSTALELVNELSEKLYRLYQYAGLSNDQDTRESKYQAFRDQVSGLAAQFGQAVAFIDPEILEIPENTLKTFVKNTPSLNEYQHYFHSLFRAKAHTLSAEQEKLLAMSSEMAQSPNHVFSMFNNADIKFGSIQDENGETVEVTKGRMSLFLESDNREVRKNAYDALYNEYKKWTNTLAATLSGAVKSNVFYARARKHTSALSAALHSDNIPVNVYENVIGAINENISPLHRYMALRKKMLKLPAVRPWDMSVPLLSEMKMKISYSEAVETIRNGLKPLGKTYLTDLENAFTNGWIDVYENQGKRSGAYSWSTYGAHPYILMNYNNTLDNMFTLAHELGHAMHSFYTNKTQPYQYGNYTIFVAEVASTLNEALVMDYLLKTTDNPQKKLYLLNQYVDTIRGTVFVQALFAEFEKNIYEISERGEALTASELSKLMGELYQRYFGEAFEIDEVYAINWCRIPHFYYNFYVYQYATGLSAATELSQKILAGDTTARDAYLRFLSRGSSAYSIDLLKDAGVDMTSPKPIATTAQLMNRLLDEMEAIINA